MKRNYIQIQYKIKTMAKFMIIGPVTRDRIIKREKSYNTIGGGVYYQSAVISGLGVDNTVITTLSKSDNDLIEGFPKTAQIIPVYKDKTMEFENIYPDDNPNHRVQRSTVPVNPLKPKDFKDINWDSYHAMFLSPLSPCDIPLKTVRYLEKQDIPIYLGAQGYLRHIQNENVVLEAWNDYQNFLKLVDFLFLDELEARAILVNHSENCAEIAQILSSYGPEEVVVTRGDRGAIISSKKGNHDIPAHPPRKVVDPTGLGDTFMAAYAVKKLETDDPEKCGRFAAEMSSRKLEQRGALKISKKK